MFRVVIVSVPRCILVHSIPFDVVLHSVHTYNMFVAHSINLTLSYVLAHSIFLVVNYFISNVLLAHSALNFISFVIELLLGWLKEHVYIFLLFLLFMVPLWPQANKLKAPYVYLCHYVCLNHLHYLFRLYLFIGVFQINGCAPFLNPIVERLITQ